ncbi:MAG: DUF1194 domain-containing protein [Akkermansiaceae bacterium]|nr:DUF1194 domain-containing protein [Akkermansiaceae bacterium]
MKTPRTKHTRSPQSRRRFVRAMSLGIATLGMLAPAGAESVDSEILLLVDITRPELSQREFERLMDGYATSFSSSQVLDSIQSGNYGRIAVSMMFFGQSSLQVVGIPWMSIGNASQAQQFADLARSVVRPMTIFNSNVAAALNAATPTFGTETGGTSNGFESAVQIIEVASTHVPSNATAAATATASSNALASGVDIINALALGNRANAVETFYASNVIGSTIQGVPATTETSRFSGTLAGTMNGMFTESVQTAATISVTAVPEPSQMYGLIPATLLLLRRRRR